MFLDISSFWFCTNYEVMLLPKPNLIERRGEVPWITTQMGLSYIPILGQFFMLGFLMVGLSLKVWVNVIKIRSNCYLHLSKLLYQWFWFWKFSKLILLIILCDYNLHENFTNFSNVMMLQLTSYINNDII